MRRSAVTTGPEDKAEEIERYELPSRGRLSDCEPEDQKEGGKEENDKPQKAKRG